MYIKYKIVLITVSPPEVYLILSDKKFPYVTSFFFSWNNNTSVIKYFKSENKPENYCLGIKHLMQVIELCSLSNLKI